MKNNLIKYSFLAIAATICMASCKSEKEEMDVVHYTNKLFLSISGSSETILVKPGASDVTRSISMATALPVEADVTAMINPDLTLVSAFRAESGIADAQAFPLDNCNIEDPRIEIKKGAVKSSSTDIEFTNLSDLDSKTIYVLPVALKQVNGMTEVLQSKTHYYYVFKGAALVNVVCNLNDNRAGAASWKTPEKFTNMTKFTCEALVRQNAADHQISTIMGVEDHFLLRLGDSGTPSSQLQIAASSKLSNSNMAVTLGKWTHMAIVFDSGKVTVYFDGKKVLDNGSCGRSSVTWGAYGDNPQESGARYFWIGYSYNSDRFLNGDMCEVRLWDHCLTADEINQTNHFYSVDPTSDGLIAYWKMDEGSGTVLKDSSPNGNDLTLDKETRWPSVSLPN